MPIIKLSEKWIKMLLAERETGMGYQIVSVTLQDGSVFNQVVIDSGYIAGVRGYKDIPFQESDIRNIKVTHDKWDWDSE